MMFSLLSDQWQKIFGYLWKTSAKEYLAVFNVLFLEIARDKVSSKNLLEMDKRRQVIKDVETPLGTHERIDLMDNFNDENAFEFE